MHAISWMLLLLASVSPILALLPSVLPVHAQSVSSSLKTGRVTVRFNGNTHSNALHVSSKFNLPIIMEEDVLQFALFQPPNPDYFLSSVKQVPGVKDAEPEYYECFTGAQTCGGGGGGGGGGGTPPQFFMVANPSGLELLPGSSGRFTVNVTSQNGFSGTVNLTPSTTAAYNTTPSSTSVTLASGGSATSTLTVFTSTASALGNYTMSTEGCSSSYCYQLLVYLTIGANFRIAASPTSMAFLAGNSGTGTVMLTSVNGFSGTASLTLSTCCNSPSGFSASLSPTSITLASGGSGSSTLAISTTASTPSATYQVNVCGTAGVSHLCISLSVMVTPDYGMAANPTLLNVASGSSATFTITLASTGLSGDVRLSTEVSPGVTASLNPTTVTLSPGGSGISILTVSAASSSSGGYQVDVLGWGDNVTDNGIKPIFHIVGVSVTVPFPGDPSYRNQWGPPDLNLYNAWGRTVGAHNRIIAIVDSGMYFDHPDLKGNLWTASDGSHGWNCAATPQNNDASDDIGHGTLVAGVAAALINNGLGIAGTAQEWLMSVKIGSATQGPTDVTEACGIRWAVDHGANVINLSVSGPGTPTMDDAVRYAWQHGALLIAAVSESSSGGTSSVSSDCPACFGEVVAVSALQQGDTIACFSDYGTGQPGPVGGINYTPELTAPGVNILSTNWPGTVLPSTRFGACTSSNATCHDLYYCYVDGTSLAAPFVSGIAALAWDYNVQNGPNTFTNQEIRSALDTYVSSPSSANMSCFNTCNDYYGWGKPDAAALLQAMVSAHSYTLTARWFFELSSGNEGSAGVLLKDITDPNNWEWITPCCTVPTVGNGLTVQIMAGHRIYVYFTAFFNDGSNWVYLSQVTSGLSGSVSPTPAYSDTTSLACGVNFVFPPVSASNEADYNIAFFGNPYAGISCSPQSGVPK